jgi:hypothetical protein
MKGFLFGCLAFAAVATVVLCPSLALAQSTVDAEPLVDFTAVFDDLRDTVTAVIVGAVGIGLAIWATRYVFSVVRSMGRG